MEEENDQIDIFDPKNKDLLCGLSCDELLSVLKQICFLHQRINNIEKFLTNVVGGFLDFK